MHAVDNVLISVSFCCALCCVPFAVRHEHQNVSVFIRQAAVFESLCIHNYDDCSRLYSQLATAITSLNYAECERVREIIWQINEIGPMYIVDFCHTHSLCLQIVRVCISNNSFLSIHTINYKLYATIE